jgi:DNA helicase HerA-like ATPase
MTGSRSPITIARSSHDIAILPHMANRHGLISGATGTGKTVTLRVLAEHFSRLGVPCFLADVKGDLSGLCQPGGDDPKVAERVQTLGLAPFSYQACPVVFWDVWGVQGHPLRTTISEMGPLLLARLLNLNEIQSGVLTLAFQVADDEGLLLLDLKDLRAMVQFVGDHAHLFRTRYGNITAGSIGAIQRSLMAIEHQGADRLFGEPALNLFDLLRTAPGGDGILNILTADKLLTSPQLYATLLLWLVSELFEQLPEVGDPPKPKLVFFFDEARLLFEAAPKVLLDKILQLVRLIRSKGVGIYFVSQSPLDLPEAILGQLGHRFQHALRAFTPRDQKAVKAVAETFRQNPELDVAQAVTELGVGEALVSVLDARGIPSRVERALIYPPRSRLKPLTPEERALAIRTSAMYGRYDRPIDRESAYEMLKARTEELGQESNRPTASPLSQAGEVIGAMAKSAARSIGTQLGRQIMRGTFGALFGKRRKK